MKANLDNFDTVMALTDIKDGYLVIPEGVMYDGKVFKGYIGSNKPDAQVAMNWHHAVRAEYARQESEANESNNKAAAVRGPEERPDPNPKDEAGVRPAVPPVESSIEEVLQARLEAATVACESAGAALKAAEEAYADACVEESKLKLLVEALSNGT